MTGKDSDSAVRQELRAAFAVPGDLKTLTGGYKYDRALISGLQARGWTMTHLELGDSFPKPTKSHMKDAAQQLAAQSSEVPVIIDGLALVEVDRAVLEGMRAPLVALIHHPLAYESGASEDEQAAFLLSERQNLRYAAHVLVPSPHTAEVLVSDYAVDQERITVARPGTEPPTSQSSKDHPPLILSVGIQVPRKGHDVLLRALARLQDLPWMAVIAGGVHDKEHAKSLATLTKDLGLSERVVFLGRVSDKILAELYGRAHVFALATRYEGYGIVFDEAMAHGLPIVSCKVGAVPETVDPNAARLVAAEDDMLFAEALKDVLCDKDLHRQMASASATAGKALPTWDVTARTVAQVLQSVSVTQKTRA